MRQKITIPYDYDATSAIPDWRDVIIWPIIHRDYVTLLRNQSCQYLRLASSMEGDLLRNTVLLTSYMLPKIRALTMAAYTFQAAKSKGIELIVTSHEIQSLYDPDCIFNIDKRTIYNKERPIKLQYLKRVARTASWTSFGSLLGTLSSPDILAISHNSLLRAAAASSEEKIGFRHSERFLAYLMRKKRESTNFDEVEYVSTELTRALVGDETLPGLEKSLAERLFNISLLFCREAVLKSHGIISALHKEKCMPSSVWSATGSNYSARAIGLEVLRRGGEVTRFSHSGASGVLDNIDTDAIGELSVSSKFVVATKTLAKEVEKNGALDLVSNLRDVSVVGFDGDPDFKSVPSTKKRLKNRPHVIYASTILSGARQFSPPLLPDLVYLDWQIRLINMLIEMPVEFVFKPHPEGLLRGKTHPMGKEINIYQKPFEVIMDSMDVLVFDYPATTTFWKGVCSGANVVFIDMGNLSFTENVKNLVNNRCQIIQATYGDDGKPHVDPKELRSAIFSSDFDQESQKAFRRLLAGD